MTTIDTRPGAGEAAVGAPGTSTFFATVGAWVTSSDHKRIGRLYLGFGLFGLLAVSLIGLLVGIERADESSALLDAGSRLQLFQAHRIGLVFAVAMPLGLGLSIAVAPLQLGARQIAFPRLALTGFYAWLGGLGLTIASLVRHGGMGGSDQRSVELFLAALGLMILGLLASAGSVATSVLTTRAPGMTMRRVPLFAWSALIGALGMLIALPVVFGVVIYLMIDLRAEQLNFGGAEGIGDWVGWAFSVPSVVIYALPAIGVAAELIPVTFRSRQALRGVAFAGIALVGVAALAATTQQFVHDVTFDTDGSTFFDGAVPFLIFAGLPLLGVLVVMALGAGTAVDGLAPKGGGNRRVHITAAFVLSFFGLGLVLVGIAGNALQSITDLELLGTTFEEGATLFVVYGTVLAVLGGIAFWAPKLWGRVLPERQVLPLALLGAAGVVLAGAPLYVAGFLDQGGGVPSSDADVTALLSLAGVDSGGLWMTLSLIGHGLVAFTVLVFAASMVATFTGQGELAGPNPYGGQTIEWSTSSPAPVDNFEQVPTVASPEPVFDLSHEGSQA